MGSGADNAVSGRELEILGMAACGPSNARIADALHISEATVKRHLANVYEKMGVSSRAEAVGLALANGWLSLADLLPNGPGDPVGDDAAPGGAVYRCAAPGCGREVVEVRPPAGRQPGARLSCHGREMDRAGPPEG